MIDPFKFVSDKIFSPTARWFNRGYLQEKSLRSRLIEVGIMGCGLIAAIIGATQKLILGWTFYIISIMIFLLKIDYDGRCFIQQQQSQID